MAAENLAAAPAGFDDSAQIIQAKRGGACLPCVGVRRPNCGCRHSLLGPYLKEPALRSREMQRPAITERLAMLSAGGA